MKYLQQLANVFFATNIIFVPNENNEWSANAQVTEGTQISETKELSYTDENYGDIKFSYFTYQENQSELGLPLSFIQGKLEITDRNQAVFQCDPDTIDWEAVPEPVCRGTKIDWVNTEWLETSQIRVAMEFGDLNNDEYLNHRDQIRFIHHLNET